MPKETKASKGSIICYLLGSLLCASIETLIDLGCIGAPGAGASGRRWAWGGQDQRDRSARSGRKFSIAPQSNRESSATPGPPTQSEQGLQPLQLHSKAVLATPTLKPESGVRSTERGAISGPLQSTPHSSSILCYSCISSSGRVPERWRTALLVPIYKGRGQAADVTNHRPLPMPTVACRLWSSSMNQGLTAVTKAILAVRFRIPGGLGTPSYSARQYVWLQTRPALR